MEDHARLLANCALAEAVYSGEHAIVIVALSFGASADLTQAPPAPPAMPGSLRARRAAAEAGDDGAGPSNAPAPPMPLTAAERSPQLRRLLHILSVRDGAVLPLAVAACSGKQAILQELLAAGAAVTLPVLMDVIHRQSATGLAALLVHARQLPPSKPGSLEEARWTCPLLYTLVCHAQAQRDLFAGRSGPAEHQACLERHCRMAEMLLQAGYSLRVCRVRAEGRGPAAESGGHPGWVDLGWANCRASG